MSAIEQAAPLTQALQQPYRHGFVTEVETDSLPPGLDEDIVRAISKRKREPEFLLKWRLAAFERWQKMPMPEWGKLRIAPIDFQALCYYSAPKSLKEALGTRVGLVTLGAPRGWSVGNTTAAGPRAPRTTCPTRFVCVELVR